MAVVIDVIFDHDAGTLAYRVDGGKVQVAVRDFPEGARMRPWMRMGEDDWCTIRPARDLS